jgi:gamma-glutamylcyclotransferase (GGCT)/AIG2-like uncharacterized protein YtfP
MSERIFVYGTLREDPEHEMYRVLAKSAKFIGDGEVQARMYDLGAYPGIVPSSDSSERVVGEVYELRRERAEHALATLDDYEGLGADDPLPHEYERIPVTVLLTSGRKMTAWAYVLANKNPIRPRIPEGDYLKWKSRQGP